MHPIRKKYHNTKYDPDPNCEKCKGKGENYISKRSAVTGEPLGWHACACIYIRHDWAPEARRMLGEAARRVLNEMEVKR